MSLKCGAATLAAGAFLVCGVEVAEAGGIADVVDDVPGATESALPKPDDASGNVVDAATQAVDAVTETVDGTVARVEASAVVSEAEGAVDQAVADPKGTVTKTVAQASSTVSGIAGVAGKIVDSPPLAKAASGVTSVVNPVASAPHETDAVRSEAPESAPSRQRSARALLSPAAKGLMRSAQPPHETSRANDRRIVVASTVALQHNRAQRALLAPLVRRTDPFSPPDSAPSHKVSRWAAAPPFAPPPGDQPATAASVASAAGASLLAALFTAFLVLAPRRCRLIRPGPILVRPEPCLSLAERPG